MDAADIRRGLTQFGDRRAGSDAERRAASWLAGQLGPKEQEVVVETFWCRPNWPLGHAVHAGVAVVGSLVSLASPVSGVAILSVALVSIVADWLTGVSLGRSLAPQHASQNVIVAPRTSRVAEAPVRLILTANYDGARSGFANRGFIRRPARRACRALAGVTPGWLGWMWLGIAWLLTIAILRLAGHTGATLRAAQLPPTVALLLALAPLVELATLGSSSFRGEDATAAGMAVAVVQALEVTPPRHLEVQLVLTGASDGDPVGLREFLRRRRQRRPTDTVVLGIASCADGSPHWWQRDGSLVPVRYARPLRAIAEEIAANEPHLAARPHQGRGSGAALPARLAGIPAITIGCLDRDGLPGLGATAKPAAFDAAFQFLLLMIDRIDAAVGDLQGQRTGTPA